MSDPPTASCLSEKLYTARLKGQDERERSDSAEFIRLSLKTSKEDNSYSGCYFQRKDGEIGDLLASWGINPSKTGSVRILTNITTLPKKHKKLQGFKLMKAEASLKTRL